MILLLIGLNFEVFTQPSSLAYTRNFDQECKEPNDTLSYQIIAAPNNSFGYDIYMDGRLIIHQPNVPVTSGDEGFRTKDDAKKVAELVISKIRAGQMPPSIILEELEDLQIINSLKNR